MALMAGRRGLKSFLVSPTGKLKAGAVDIPDATKSKKGVVKIGSGLSVAAGSVSVTNPVPVSVAADAGKVLKVKDDGSIEWADAPSGGGGVVLNVTTTNKATELYRVTQVTATMARIVSEAEPPTSNCPGLWKIDVSNVEYIRFAIAKNSIGSKSKDIYAMFSDKDFTEETGENGPGYLYLESTTSRSTLSGGFSTNGKKYLYFSIQNVFSTDDPKIFVFGY